MTEAEIAKVHDVDLIFYIKNGKLGMGHIAQKGCIVPGYPGMECVILDNAMAVPYQFTYRYIWEANRALVRLWRQDETAGTGSATDEALAPDQFECSNCGCDCDYTRSCGVDYFNFCPVCGARITKHMSEQEE